MSFKQYMKESKLFIIMGLIAFLFGLIMVVFGD